MFHKHQINDTETVDELLDLFVDEINSKFPENGLSLAKNIVAV
jgi:HPt (histidine-containing phosphotransfer) domain-containing protein